MNPAFASQLSPKIQKINIGAQKIDGTTLKTYELIIFTFFVSNKDDGKRFFKESFLLAEVKLERVLGMLFLTMSNIDIDFEAWGL